VDTGTTLTLIGVLVAVAGAIGSLVLAGSKAAAAKGEIITEMRAGHQQIRGDLGAQIIQVRGEVNTGHERLSGIIAAEIAKITGEYKRTDDRVAGVERDVARVERRIDNVVDVLADRTAPVQGPRGGGSRG